MENALTELKAELNGTTTEAPPTAPEVKSDAESEEDKKDPRYIAVTMTPELLKAIRDNAGTKPLGTYLQGMIAEQLGVKLPVPQRTRTRYDNEEDKKAAQEKALKQRQLLIKALQASHRARMALAEGKAINNKDIETLKLAKDAAIPGIEYDVIEGK